MANLLKEAGMFLYSAGEEVEKKAKEFSENREAKYSEFETKIKAEAAELKAKADAGVEKVKNFADEFSEKFKFATKKEIDELRAHLDELSAKLGGMGKDSNG